MGASIRFRPEQCWELNGQRIRFVRELGDELLHFIVERTSAPLQIETSGGSGHTPDRSWAVEAFAQGRLRQVPTLERLAGARLHAQTREYASDQIAELDPKARLRHFVLTSFDRSGQFSTSTKAIRRGLIALWAAKPERAADIGAIPPVRTVRRWMVERGSHGERPMRQMMAMTGRVPRRRRLPPATVMLLQKAAIRYWSTPRISIEDAYAWMAKWVIRVERWRAREPQRWPEALRPSCETLRTQIRRLECYQTYAAKFGDRKAAARFKPTGRGLSAARFLQLGCMDHTLLDGIAVIDLEHMLPVGRPWLTVLIDVRTRCVVSFVLSFEPPSLYLATECIKRANRPKLHMLSRAPKFPVLAYIFGRFDEVVVDNGWELAGISFEDAMADVGTSVRWAPIASPTYKAIVERFFGILNHILNTKLPGGVLNPGLLREMGYDPAKDAVLTIAEIEDLIWEALEYYHIELHTGVGRPPASLWQQDMEAFGIDVIGDDRQLDRMAGALKKGCTLTRSGVELFGLKFHDPGATGGLLEDLIGTTAVRGRRKGSATVKVKVKHNPASLAEIHVWNQLRNCYVTLPCTDERYTTGISLWHHQQLKAWAKATGLAFSTENDRLLARAKLMERIREAAPALKLKQRIAAARLMNTPKVLAKLNGDSVALGYAPSRHDGMAPMIPHATLASERIDGDRPPARPARKTRKAPPKRPPRSSAAPSTAPMKDPADGAPAPLAIAPWKGFKL